MLAFLRVENFAIIESLSVEFADGLNVITGETGAGKSIILNALTALMNQKVPSELVRTSATHAEITGQFFASDNEYLLKRIVSAQGRSRAFVNDEAVSLGRLHETASRFVNIYGQHELLHLLERDRYVQILDELLSLTDLRQELAAVIQELRSVKAAIAADEAGRTQRQREGELLGFQIGELEKDGPGRGEEEEIRERLKVLKDAEKIKEAMEEVIARLYAGEASAYGTLRLCSSLLKALAHHRDVDLLRLKLDEVAYEIDDTVKAIQDLEKRLFLDPEELGRLDERLARIWALKSKYGRTFEEMQLFLENARIRLNALRSVAVQGDELAQRRLELEGRAEALAHSLSEGRKRGVPQLRSAILLELSFLSMEAARFDIEIEERETIDETGKDDVDFLISTNPGEPLKSLWRVASGGELSRVMLAIKSVLGGDRGKTMVFDEIDAGIGGRVADMVGRRLKNLGVGSQIICVTHLPQIAAYGDYHFVVEKLQEEHTTTAAIRRLDDEERIQEIARMLGGMTVTEKTVARAEEMLRHAQESTH